MGKARNSSICVALAVLDAARARTCRCTGFVIQYQGCSCGKRDAIWQAERDLEAVARAHCAENG